MSYLIDTDIIVGWLKGRQEEVALLSKISQEGIAISLITQDEVYEGVCYGRNPEHNARTFQ
jgi:predicted nucleic acid-binding protein